MAREKDVLVVTRARARRGRPGRRLWLTVVIGMSMVLAACAKNAPWIVAATKWLSSVSEKVTAKLEAPGAIGMNFPTTLAATVPR